MHDINILDEIGPEAGAFYVMDRAYVDFERLFVFTLWLVVLRRARRTSCSNGATRIPSTNPRACARIRPSYGCHRIGPSLSRPVAEGQLLRRPDEQAALTNNFALPALTIAHIYKSRWQIELFFKWIKQHLRINSFYGTSENAVKTQIWIAVSIYVLIAIVRKRLGLEASLYQILQILSVTQFEKMPLLQALQPSDSPNESPYDPNQLILFDF